MTMKLPVMSATRPVKLLIGAAIASDLEQKDHAGINI